MMTAQPWSAEKAKDNERPAVQITDHLIEPPSGKLPIDSFIEDEVENADVALSPDKVERDNSYQVYEPELRFTGLKNYDFEDFEQEKGKELLVEDVEEVERSDRVKSIVQETELEEYERLEGEI